MIQTQGHLIPYMSSDWNPIIKCEICLLVSPSLCSPESKEPVITGGLTKANHLRPPLLAWMGFPGGSVDKKPASNAGDAGDEGLIPGSGRSAGVGQSNPLQYSCLESHMDRGAWRAAVHGVTKSWAWLSDWAAQLGWMVSGHCEWPWSLISDLCWQMLTYLFHQITGTQILTTHVHRFILS